MAKESVDSQSTSPAASAGRLRRWQATRRLRRLADPEFRRRLQAQRAQRQAATLPENTVVFFHSVADPHSYLAAQYLADLQATYNVSLQIHLIPPPSGAAARLQRAVDDCERVAGPLGLGFPRRAAIPGADDFRLAAMILAATSRDGLADMVLRVGSLLWGGGSRQLSELHGHTLGATTERLQVQWQRGREAAQDWGAMEAGSFCFGGAVYPGIDRLHHLELLLQELKLRREPGRQLIAPRPVLHVGRLPAASKMTLELYVALDSPACALVFDRASRMALDAGVRLVVCPVYPPLADDADYDERSEEALLDVLREAEAIGLDWQNGVDPMGKPVRRVLSLLHWARERGKARALLSQYYRAVYGAGADLTSDARLRELVKTAGLGWDEARGVLARENDASEFEDHRKRVQQLGLARLPAFRLSDAAGDELLRTAGHDRLWLVAATIDRFCEAPEVSESSLNQAPRDVMTVDYPPST